MKGDTGDSGASQLGVANTWTAIQTFNQPPVMSGASITANTIPSSSINGGISVSLPTTTMATRTSTQIGYQLTASFPYGNSSPNSLLCSIQLSPIGSVWIVQMQIEFSSNTTSTNLTDFHWGVTSDSSASWSLGGGNRLPGLYNYMNQMVQIHNNQNGSIVGRTGVHVVAANTTYINLGHYINYSNNVTKVGGILIATRIA